MPGWSVQTSLKLPAFGNVYVAVAGGAFGPCGLMRAARRGRLPGDRLRPERPERRRVVDEFRPPVEVERLAGRSRRCPCTSPFFGSGMSSGIGFGVYVTVWKARARERDLVARRDGQRRGHELVEEDGELLEPARDLALLAEEHGVRVRRRRGAVGAAGDREHGESRCRAISTRLTMEPPGSIAATCPRPPRRDRADDMPPAGGCPARTGRRALGRLSGPRARSRVEEVQARRRRPRASSGCRSRASVVALEAGDEGDAPAARAARPPSWPPRPRRPRRRAPRRPPSSSPDRPAH